MRRSSSLLLMVLCPLLLLLAACGGGTGGTGVPEDTAPAPAPGPDLRLRDGQALLGPVVGGAVEVFLLEDLDTALCTTQTVDSRDLDIAGRITIDPQCIELEGLYLVRVSGGTDIDADDDGEIDPSPTPVRGSFHAVISGRQMRDTDWIISPITESVYRAITVLLDMGASDALILNTLDELARVYLTSDINLDGIIDGHDLLVWNPQRDFDKVNDPEALREVIETIHSDDLNFWQTTDNVPLIDGVIAHVNTRLVARQVIYRDGLAYVATPASLLVIDTGDAADPELVGFLPTLTSAKDLTLDGNRAYISSSAGVQVIDISDAARLRTLGILPFHAIRVAIVNEYLAVLGDNSASGELNVSLVDVSDIAIPEVLSQVAVTPNMLIGEFKYHLGTLFLAGFSMASVSTNWHFLQLAGPQTLSLTAVHSIREPYGTYFIDANLAYIGVSRVLGLAADHVKVVDITDLSSIVELDRLDIDEPYHLQLRGDYLYVISYRDGDSSLDIHTVSPLELVASIGLHNYMERWMDAPKSFAIDGQTIYIAAEKGGFIIGQVPIP